MHVSCLDCEREGGDRLSGSGWVDYEVTIGLLPGPSNGHEEKEHGGLALAKGQDPRARDFRDRKECDLLAY
jgi:hypothetical protein